MTIPRMILCIYGSLFLSLWLYSKPQTHGAYAPGYRQDRHVVVLSAESSVPVPQFFRSLFK